MKPIIDAFTHNESRLRGRDSFRIFHGRGGTYPDYHWCNIDYFHPVILLTLYREPPEERLAQLRHFLARQQENHLLRGMLIQRRYLPGAPTEFIMDESAQQVYARRGELEFRLSFSQQNCGYFLDIEPARLWLEKICPGKTVLNLFSYTCTFSVVAMKAGAASVVNIDLSRKSLGTGQYNHHHNGIDTGRVRFLPHDIFKSWGRLNSLGPFDIVIVDPPSYQKGSFIALPDYPKVLRRMDRLVAADGLFLACLNAPEIKRDDFENMITSAAETFALERSLPVNPDFPEVGESALKMLIYKRREENELNYAYSSVR